MTDWTTARVTPETLAELRRLLDCSSKLPWECYRPHFASGYHSITLIGAAVNALPALLDAAAERDRLAEAWDDGHQAGHEDARAVQSPYPEPTPNPYRTEGDPR